MFSLELLADMNVVAQLMGGVGHVRADVTLLMADCVVRDLEAGLSRNMAGGSIEGLGNLLGSKLLWLLGGEIRD